MGFFSFLETELRKQRSYFLYKGNYTVLELALQVAVLFDFLWIFLKRNSLLLSFEVSQFLEEFFSEERHDGMQQFEEVQENEEKTLSVGVH